MTMHRTERYKASGGWIFEGEPVGAMLYDADRGDVLSRLSVFGFYCACVDRRAEIPPDVLAFVAGALRVVLSGEWADVKRNAYRMFNPQGRSKMPAPNYRDHAAIGLARWDTSDSKRKALRFEGRDVTRQYNAQVERENRLWRVQELLLDRREAVGFAAQEKIAQELDSLYADASTP